MTDHHLFEPHTTASPWEEEFDRVMEEFEGQTDTIDPPPLVEQQGIIVRFGSGMMTFHSTISDSQGRPVGAVFAAEHTCAECHQAFGPNQVVVAGLLPNLGGRFQHSDCNDTELLGETEQL